MKKRWLWQIIALILSLALTLSSCTLADILGDTGANDVIENDNTDTNGKTDGTESGGSGDSTTTTPTPIPTPDDTPTQDAKFDPSEIPEYSGSAYVKVNGNKPFFTEDDYTTESYEYYNELDSLGRCTYAMASVGKDLMPETSGTGTGSVNPTGWEYNKQYPSQISTKDLYNRCHLIAHQLTGEKGNAKNLITGTRYMNEAMIEFENMVADSVKESGYHVLYRVTPVFEGNNLVASGVLMEAYSVDDGGEDVCFCVYLYNVQPNIYIDYTTGENRLADGVVDDSVDVSQYKYVINTNNNKFHKADCSQGPSQKNSEYTNEDRETLISKGYKSAGCCNP